MTRNEPITKYDDAIDSRDVIARLEYLDDNASTLDDDEKDERIALTAFAAEAEPYAEDWQFGCTLIRRSYWVKYVQEMLEDCGELPTALPSYIVIDWEATARNIEVDYTTVDFDGVEYLVR